MPVRKLYRPRVILALAVVAVILVAGTVALQTSTAAPTPKLPPACDQQHPGECKRAIAYWKKQAREKTRALRWQKRQLLRARTITASNLTPLEVGRALALRRAWAGREWACLVTLWSRESGWEPTKKNYAGSGAYGIPQALPGRKMASAGADWRTNAGTQIRWGLGYIAARYSTPCGALAHSNARGWY